MIVELDKKSREFQIEMRLSGMQISTIRSANDGNKKTINFDKLDQITRKQA